MTSRAGRKKKGLTLPTGFIGIIKLKVGLWEAIQCIYYNYEIAPQLHSVATHTSSLLMVSDWVGLFVQFCHCKATIIHIDDVNTRILSSQGEVSDFLLQQGLMVNRREPNEERSMHPSVCVCQRDQR